MYILGIESSCDETAASVVENGRKILSSVVASQIDIHKIYGGVVPEIASRCHIEAVSSVVDKAISDSGLTLEQIDAIAVTYAPGLIGALLVGVNYAKGLSYALKKPLVPVHHLRSHIASNYLTSPDLKPPFLALVVSGGHSHIILVKDYTEFEIIAKTHDDAAGETFDKTARALGLPYPGGVHMDKLADEGDPMSFKLPRPHIDGCPLDFSFSGLKTAVINTIHRFDQKGESFSKADMAASIRYTVVDILKKSLFEAQKQLGIKKIVLAGGVSANSLLRSEVQKECEKRNLDCFIPDKKYCGDNGAMVASQGYYEYLAGHISDLSLNAYASVPINVNKFETLKN